MTIVFWCAVWGFLPPAPKIELQTCASSIERQKLHSIFRSVFVSFGGDLNFRHLLAALKDKNYIASLEVVFFPPLGGDLNETTDFSRVSRLAFERCCKLHCAIRIQGKAIGKDEMTFKQKFCRVPRILSWQKSWSLKKSICSKTLASVVWAEMQDCVGGQRYVSRI